MDSNQVGFAARMETRKCPHFLEGIDSLFFTDSESRSSGGKENLNLDTSKWKIYNYQHEQLRYVYETELGNKSLQHIYLNHLDIQYFKQLIMVKYRYWHTIGYQIMIIHLEHQHQKNLKNNMNNICNLSLQERRDILFPLREHLKQWDNKEQWRDKLLEIYNK